MTESLPYQLRLNEDAQRDLKRLDKVIAKRITQKLLKVAAVAGQVPHDALTGQWKGLFRIKIAKDYRAIYDLKHSQRIMLVVKIGHRSDVYEE